MPMRVVVAPDKFKRSLTAVKVAEAIGKGLGLGARRFAQTSCAVSRRHLA
jgi:glycerate kinase